MKQFLIPGMIGAAGLLALTLLFPRYDAARTIGSTMDRNQAIEKSRKLVSKYGVDPSHWTAVAAEKEDSHRGPVKLEVVLASPDHQQYVVLDWLPDGRLTGWRTQRLKSTEAAPALTEAPKVPASKAAAKPYRWSNETNTVTVRTSADEDDESRGAVNAAARVITVFWYIAGVVYLLIGTVRRRLHYRLPLQLMTAQIVWGLLTFWTTEAYQKTAIVQITQEHSFLTSVLASVPSAQGWAFFWIFVFGTIGFAQRSAASRGKWSTLELIGQGSLHNRAVGTSVATGMLCGLGIAAIPYLVAATGLLGGISMLLRSGASLLEPSPIASAWSLRAAVVPMGLFGFIFPWFSKIRNPKLRWALLAPLGVAISGAGAFPYTAPFSNSIANLALGVLLFASFTMLYLRFDLLSTIMAAIAARAVLTPCLLFTQPGGSVRALGVTVVLSGAALLAVALHAAVRGKEGAEEIPAASSETELAEDVITETGRARLEAEFDVARKAQQDALPSTAPPVAGFSIAGSCEPAQQVGGDLYDYYPLADGRLGIAVADVSGKGVPAALYMMVTKGLLAAATRDSSDLAYILDQTNLHLYRACKKKVFVTLAAVALDPATGKLQHGRAGHNPIFWRRTHRGETQMLKPPGVGLGMTSGERFGRTLKIEELQMEPGDAILMYSDGVTEAVNGTMEQYGEPRLQHVFETTDGMTAEESRVAILRDLAEFVGTTPARDDITVVVVRADDIAVGQEIV